MSDEPGKTDPGTLNPKFLRLPPGLAETGDPVEGNPFPPEDVRHGMWQRATRDAVERVSRLKADWLVWQETQAELHPTVAPETLREFLKEKRRVLVEEFQIWAGRVTQVVLTDADVRRTDDWLVGYADSFLQFQATQMMSYGVPVRGVERELSDLRNTLTAVVLHWKAEARRVCRLREADREEHQATGTPTPRSQHPASVSALKVRAGWLRAALDTRKWTVQDLARHGGPDPKTIRRILAGDAVRETVLERLAQGLSAKGPVRLDDIPND